MGNDITLDMLLYGRKTIGSRPGWCTTTRVDVENWRFGALAVSLKESQRGKITPDLLNIRLAEQRFIHAH